jgi:DNA-directed RNA polymerase subunit RPC12/RpoP
MKNSTGLTVAVVLLLAAAALFGWQFWSRSPEKIREQKRLALSSYYLCEACGKEFLAPGGSPTAKCPECNAESSIRRIKKRCNKCGEEFIQYEVDTKTNFPRYPGGSWNPGIDTDRGCTNCGSKDCTSLPERK